MVASIAIPGVVSILRVVQVLSGGGIRHGSVRVIACAFVIGPFSIEVEFQVAGVAPVFFSDEFGHDVDVADHLGRDEQRNAAGRDVFIYVIGVGSAHSFYFEVDVRISG